MGRDWIIDVLADLRRFTRENNLPMLTAQLEEAGLVAEVEIASSNDASCSATRTDAEAPAKQGIPRRS